MENEVTLSSIVAVLTWLEKQRNDPRTDFRFVIYSDGSGSIDGLEWCCDDHEFTEFEFSSLEDLRKWTRDGKWM